MNSRQLGIVFRLILISGWLVGCGVAKTSAPGTPQAPRISPTLPTPLSSATTIPLSTIAPSPSIRTHTATSTPLSVVTLTSSPTQVEFSESITLTGHTCSVWHLKWSPDGTLLASSCGNLSPPPADDTVIIWHPDGTVAYTLTGYSESIPALDWSPDGKILATGSSDGSIRLWDKDGQLIKKWESNAGTVFSVAWSPDGEVLASGSIVTYTNPTVQLWNPAGQIITTLSTSFSGGKFYNLAWSPDGKYLLGGATDYKLWKADGEQVFWLKSCAHCTPAWGVAWAPDSQLWAVGNENGEVEIYDTTGKLVTHMQDRTDVNSLGWSPDGKLLAGAKTLWRSDGTAVATLSSPALRVDCVAWSPDGSLLATGNDHGLILLYTAEGKPMGILRGHARSIDALAWSPDGRVLASGSDDTTIRLWIIK